jgi:hypothetical protein
MPHFECGAFDHSATSPGAMAGWNGPRSGRVLGEDGGPDKARTDRIWRGRARKTEPSRRQEGATTRHWRRLPSGADRRRAGADPDRAGTEIGAFFQRIGWGQAE